MIKLKKLIYILVGIISVLLGTIGIILPILPTTPFYLLASFCFVRGSDRFDRWFKGTKLYKNNLESFIDNREMTLRQKISILVFADIMLLFPLIILDSVHVKIFIIILIVYKYYYFTYKIKTSEDKEGISIMDKIINIIFPKSADNNYRGNKVASVVFLLIALVGTVRSCIHILAPDGGAGSIAGMDLTIAGAEGIIFAFSLWGSAQLLYAFIQLVVYFRYKTLIPFMYLLMVLETAMRMFVGMIKPVQFAHTPPGGFANYIILPLAIIMFYLAIRNKDGDIL